MHWVSWHWLWRWIADDLRVRIHLTSKSSLLFDGIILRSWSFLAYSLYCSILILPLDWRILRGRMRKWSWIRVIVAYFCILSQCISARHYLSFFLGEWKCWSLACSDSRNKSWGITWLLVVFVLVYGFNRWWFSVRLLIFDRDLGMQVRSWNLLLICNGWQLKLIWSVLLGIQQRNLATLNEVMLLNVHKFIISNSRQEVLLIIKFPIKTKLGRWWRSIIWYSGKLCILCYFEWIFIDLIKFLLLWNAGVSHNYLL